MILANQSVGRFVVRAGLPLLFRVHEEPGSAALERFAEVALTFAPGASPRDVETIPALRRFLAALPPGAMTRILHAFFLRSLKQAVYSPIDLGHFGLGIDQYCHFTSPIRRYPDLFNHRVVRWLIQNSDAEEGECRRVAQSRHEQARSLAGHCCRTERTAVAAEREITRIKMLRWAECRLGEVHWGRVVGLTPRGLFIEFEEFPVEGFVPRATLRAGSRLREERMAFVDERSKWELRLGDRVEVRIVRVEIRERQLDLNLVGRGKEALKGTKSATARGKPAGRRKAVREKPERRERIKPARGRADRRRGGGRSGKQRPPRHKAGGSR